MLCSQHHKSWVVCYVVAFAEIFNAEYSWSLISHFSHFFSFSFVSSVHTSFQTSSSDHFSCCFLSFFRWSYFFFINIYDEEYIQSFQDCLNQLCVSLKHHHHSWTSSLLHAFFFNEIIIINSCYHYHYLMITSESIIQDLSSNEIVNNTLIKSKDKFKWTKTRNCKRKFYISNSSNTSLKAFIHAVFKCFNSCILSKDLKRQVLHHQHQQLFHYESH